MAQRFYAARSDAECQKIGLLWTVLFAFRWPMVVGFVVLAVSLTAGSGASLEPERVIPIVLNSDYFPPGARGLMLAALLAAAMSTFDSTLNAGAAYLVKDIYEPLRRRASERELVWVGYAASALIVVLGLGIAAFVGSSVVAVWVNIVMLLFPAFLVPFALRWYWSRFNGGGFAGGIGAGFFTAWLTQAGAFGALNEAQQFLVIAGCSLAGALVATFATAPVPHETLRSFYERVRPAGWWPTAWKKSHAAEHRRDGVRLGVAVLWQIATFLLPMAAVLQRWPEVVVLAGLSGGLGWWLLRDSRT
ncbi:MAG TPA: sodium:solute symporter, partial [Acidobacteriota bacterium]|nr:sodium:solute symporter [Acidobacteriota bacterium]